MPGSKALYALESDVEYSKRFISIEVGDSWRNPFYAITIMDHMHRITPMCGRACPCMKGSSSSCTEKTTCVAGHVRMKVFRTDRQKLV